MIIPNGPEGSPAENFPTLFPSRLKAYGAGPAHDQFRGCPAQYRAKYVDKSIVEVAEESSARDFGSAIHGALYHMEENACGPEEALREVWPARLGLERWAEAIDVLNKYLDRGGPMARYGTLAVEASLFAPLYDDPDFGPIWFGGTIDWLGLDINETQVVHHVDYKSNQRPLDADEVRMDIQIRGYDWLIHQCWESMGLPGRPHTVAHMDGIRWNDVEQRYTDQDRAEWAEWAAAVARTILRDEDAEEIVSAGCRWCPRKMSCNAYLALPGDSKSVAVRRLDRPLPELWEWRQEAYTLKKTLEDGISEVDALMVAQAEQDGPFVIEDQRWEEEEIEGDVIDLERLHEVLGDVLFYDVAKVTKTALDKIIRAHPDRESQIRSCVERMVVDRKVKRRKVKL